jgi:renalase
MATRTLRETGTAWDGHIVDIGASYFTVRDPAFQVQVTDWLDRGLARPRTDTFHVATPDGIEGVRVGPMRFAAPAGLRSLVADLADPFEDGVIHSSTDITSVEHVDGEFAVHGEQADAVALCLPIPQALQLWEIPPQHVWEPVIAVTAVYEERVWAEFDGIFVNDDPVLTWIEDDGRRRGDGAAVLVAHVHPVFAARHLTDPEAVLPHVLQTLARILRTETHPAWVDVQRWSFARPIAGNAEPYWRDPNHRLGLAGDGWHDGPRVEAAWLSGTALGTDLMN